MKRKKILLVDDSSTTLMLEQMILKNEPFDVVIAKDGQEAVARSLEEMPDLILMDVMMPNLNGFQACEQIKTRDKTKDIPVIIVTTRGESGNVEQGFSTGCNDYVTKPINRLELLSKVKNLLGE